MLKPLSLIFIISLLPPAGFCQVKSYKLLDKTFSANINYRAVNNIDTFRPGIKMLDSVFNPVKGKFIVYRFIASFIGDSYTGKKKEFHDVIIIKTDKSSKILDAYQYTLEWSEIHSGDLYKSTAKNIYLANNMGIEKFKFSCAWNADKNERALKEQGIIVVE